MNRVRLWWYLAAIAIATGGVYAQTLSHASILLDDPIYVYDNPAVLGGLDADGIRWAFSPGGYAGNWHPLTWLSHMLDVSVFGATSVGAHHAVNVLLHILNASLLLLLLARMTGDVERSAVVAALFALHPLHVESVAWISSRKDVLSCFFWLLTSWIYIGHAERRGRLRYFALLTAFALGLLSKSVLVTLPFALLLLDYWPLRRFSIERVEARIRLSGSRTLLVEKLPLFLLAAAASVVTYADQRAALASGVSFGYRLANAIVSYAVYIERTFWPVGLAPYYPHSLEAGQLPLGAGAVVVSSFVLLAVTVGCIAAHRSGRRAEIVGWLFYLGTLVPMIGLVQVGTAAMADRYTYIPSIGLFVVLVWGTADLAASGGLPRILRVAAAGVVVVACAVSTYFQVGVWKDDLTLFRHTVDVTRNNERAHSLLGMSYEEQGRIDEAKRHLRLAIEIDPKELESRFRLGQILISEGDFESALPVLAEASELAPQYVALKRARGKAFLGVGDFEGASQPFEEWLELRPNSPEALERLAWSYLSSGDEERAELALSLASRSVERTDTPSIRQLETLAAAQARNGDFESAMATLQRALESAGRGAVKRRDRLRSLLESYRRLDHQSD